MAKKSINRKYVKVQKAYLSLVKSFHEQTKGMDLSIEANKERYMGILKDYKAQWIQWANSFNDTHGKFANPHAFHNQFFKTNEGM